MRGRALVALAVGAALTGGFASWPGVAADAAAAPEPRDSVPLDVMRRTTLIVHDIEASIRFYRDVLHFEVWLDNRGKTGAGGLPVDLPAGSDTRLVVMKGRHPWVGMVGLLQYGPAQQAPPPRPFARAGDPVLMIESQDVRGAWARMQRAGVRTLRPPVTNEVQGAGGTRWTATFVFLYDPDGHLIELNQREPLPVKAATAASAATPAALPVRRGYFDARFGQLHYRRTEPHVATRMRPPLVLLHQTPLSSRMFTEVMPELARDRVVYALDTPGYGESDAPPKVPTIGEYADALNDFVSDLKEPVDLVGYHTGALIAADLAARHPGSVRRLVLISFPLLSPERLARLDTETPIQPDGSHVMAGWKSTMDTRPPEQSLEQAARIVAEKQRAGSRAGWAMAAIKAHDTPATLRALRIPTIVIRVNDTLAKDSSAAAALIPGARLIETPPEWRYGLFDAQPRGMAEVILRAVDE